MKKKMMLFMLSTMVTAATLKASERRDSSKIYFQNAFDELKSMLEGKIPASFERAVFVSENPYWDNIYSYEDFQNAIDAYLYCINRLIRTNDKSDTMNFNVAVNARGRFKMSDVRYTENEKKEFYKNALKNWAIFKYITDTTGIYPFYHLPFSYASNDPFGKKNWGNSQVINLLVSKEQKGNCFALSAFYKILSNRLNSGAKICTAPQHIYILHQDSKGDFYNVELATAGFPGDGMIQTLTYTTSDAIMSGISLRSYSEKESIGLCLVNLAKSYEHKFDTKGDEFILKCAELALKNDSLNLNALLLKQQVLDEMVKSYATKNNITDITRLRNDTHISATVLLLQEHILKLYDLGYRQMPVDMQRLILNGFSGEPTGSIYTDKNPRPFTTIKPKDKKDEQYWTLSNGTLQEVFEHKKLEIYGHFTFNTETKTIAAIDTANHRDFLIDPVAFAYNFGARMYDPQLGIFKSVDPLAAKYPMLSPYSGFDDNPIFFVDRNGKEIWINYLDVDNKPQRFQYRPGIKPVDNEFVKSAVASLDLINAVNAPVGSPLDPHTVVTLLAGTKAAIINISQVDNADDVQTQGTSAKVEITWADNIGAELTNNSGTKKIGGKQSPMTALAHELGHAFDIVTDPTGYNKRNSHYNFRYDTKEEKFVINTIEKYVATYYNEGLRNNHRADDYKTRTATTTEEALPTVDISGGLKEIKLNSNQ